MSANESMEFKDTELTLGLPGTTSDYNHPRVFGAFNFKISITNSSSVKRGFMDTVDQISLQKSSTASEPRGSSSSSTSSSTTTSVIKAAAAKARIAGWPPVRSMRQKSLVVVESSRKYVKVSADGAPYLRKLDLEMYKSYQELLRALEQMFPSLTISGKCIEDGNEVMKPAVKGMDQYMLTNEDKDGDWMLVGDVPWKMFIESCKRIRLMKSSDAVGIAPRAPIPS
ncbi:auxin-induced protein IAA4-like [Pyrus communis]|uniref:auxin-induced protein IAA4-like n=1 Tax=Pyrus communis TaxID=23211 RepID=UPI0035C0F674